MSVSNLHSCAKNEHIIEAFFFQSPYLSFFLYLKTLTRYFISLSNPICCWSPDLVNWVKNKEKMCCKTWILLPITIRSTRIRLRRWLMIKKKAIQMTFVVLDLARVCTAWSSQGWISMPKRSLKFKGPTTEWKHSTNFSTKKSSSTNVPSPS